MSRISASSSQTKMDLVLVLILLFYREKQLFFAVTLSSTSMDFRGLRGRPQHCEDDSGGCLKFRQARMGLVPDSLGISRRCLVFGSGNLGTFIAPYKT